MTVASESPPAVDPAHEAEFIEFYKTTAPALVAFLRYLGASGPVAADCVQDVMLNVLPPEWAKVENPRAYCRVACRRRYLRELGKRSREAPLSDLDPDGAALGSSQDFARVEERHDMARLMAELPAQQREVMACRLDGAEIEEIAEMLEMKVATVRSNLRHAKEKLTRLWADSEDGAVAS